MAAEIEQQFPTATIELIPSGKGRFEIVRDGTPVFEKSRLGRHPKPGEVVALLRADG